jgi:hypothetical protein
MFDPVGYRVTVSLTVIAKRWLPRDPLMGHSKDSFDLRMVSSWANCPSN